MTPVPAAAAPAREPGSPVRAPRTRMQAVRSGLVGAVGVVSGLLPHLLHHIGLLAGTAVVAGSGGTAVFAIVGLVASVPMLLRLGRRFGTWKAPAIGLAVSVLLFLLSAFVIGPAISGARSAPAPSSPDPHHHALGLLTIAHALD